jgi:glycosyltransferase involved in cell wall biosynthesis
VEFGRHADRQTFDLHFVLLTGREGPARELEAGGWPVTTLDHPPGLRPGQVGRLFWLFRRLGADVLHTHAEPALIYGAPAGRLLGARVIHTQHGAGTLLSSRQRLLVRLAGGLVHRFVCSSRSETRAALEQGIPRRVLRTLSDGIDLERFPASGPDPTGPAVIVADLTPETDLETLLHATARIVGSRPAFRLDIAGEGPHQADLVRLTRELGLGERVRFLGAVGDVPGLLGQARLFVLPVRTEGIRLRLLEAMARGLPVIATGVGGIVEVVLAERTGLLAPPGDSATLAEALLRVWDDPDLGQRLGQAGRERVEQQFDVRRMVAGYEEFYRGR